MREVKRDGEEGGEMSERGMGTKKRVERETLGRGLYRHGSLGFFFLCNDNTFTPKGKREGEV